MICCPKLELTGAELLMGKEGSASLLCTHQSVSLEEIYRMKFTLAAENTRFGFWYQGNHITAS